MKSSGLVKSFWELSSRVDATLSGIFHAPSRWVALSRLAWNVRLADGMQRHWQAITIDVVSSA